MPRRIASIVVGAMVVLLIAGFQYAENWTLIEHTIEGLKAAGPTGRLVAGILTSRSFPVVLGLIILGIAIDLWRKQRERDEEGRVSAIQSAAPKPDATSEKTSNVTATGGAATAAIGDIHIHAPAVPVPAPILAPTRPVVAPRRERTAQIEHNEPIVKAVHLDKEDIWRMGTTRNYGEDNAVGLLLPLYFDPKKSEIGARVEYARVHLIFTSSLDPPVRVDHACWINSLLDTLDLEPGETKYILLALLSGEESKPARTISTNRTKWDWYKEAGGEPLEYIGLQRRPYKLEVIIIWGGNSEFRKISELVLDLSDVPKLLSGVS
jgi:hypothetical protein